MTDEQKSICCQKLQENIAEAEERVALCEAFEDDVIADYIDALLSKIKWENTNRHIKILSAGLALINLLLCVIAVYDILTGLRAGTVISAITTQLTQGEVLAMLCVLTGCRLYVVGDKQTLYYKKESKRKRYIFIGVTVLAGVVLLALPMFAKEIVLIVPSEYFIGICLILVLISFASTTLYQVEEKTE